MIKKTHHAFSFLRYKKRFLFCYMSVFLVCLAFATIGFVQKSLFVSSGTDHGLFLSANFLIISVCEVIPLLLVILCFKKMRDSVKRVMLSVATFIFILSNLAISVFLLSVYLKDGWSSSSFVDIKWYLFTYFFVLFISIVLAFVFLFRMFMISDREEAINEERSLLLIQRKAERMITVQQKRAALKAGKETAIIQRQKVRDIFKAERNRQKLLRLKERIAAKEDAKKQKADFQKSLVVERNAKLQQKNERKTALKNLSVERKNATLKKKDGHRDEKEMHILANATYRRFISLLVSFSSIILVFGYSYYYSLSHTFILESFWGFDLSFMTVVLTIICFVYVSFYVAFFILILVFRFQYSLLSFFSKLFLLIHSSITLLVVTTAVLDFSPRNSRLSNDSGVFQIVYLTVSFILIVAAFIVSIIGLFTSNALCRKMIPFGLLPSLSMSPFLMDSIILYENNYEYYSGFIISLLVKNLFLCSLLILSSILLYRAINIPYSQIEKDGFLKYLERKRTQKNKRDFAPNQIMTEENCEELVIRMKELAGQEKYVEAQKVKDKIAEYQKCTSSKKESFFDGHFLQLFGWLLLAFLVNCITVNVLFPVTLCWIIKWRYSHTVYDGNRLFFSGNGFQLLGKWVIWLLLSIITFGIFAFFVPIKIEKWKAFHTHLQLLE